MTSNICSDPSQQSYQASESIGVAFLNLVGLGGIPGIAGMKTPLDKVKDQLQQVTQETQDLNTKMTQAALQGETKISRDLFFDLQTQSGYLQEVINDTNEKLEEKIISNQIYIAALFIIFLIMMFYLLSKK
jgi:uncharacterized phage infection (PIP) family protein YhgE